MGMREERMDRKGRENGWEGEREWMGRGERMGVKERENGWDGGRRDGIAEGALRGRWTEQGTESRGRHRGRCFAPCSVLVACV